MAAMTIATAPPTSARHLATTTRIRGTGGGSRAETASGSFMRASHAADHAFRQPACHPAPVMTPSCALVLRQQALGRIDQGRRIDALALHFRDPGSGDWL